MTAYHGKSGTATFATGEGNEIDDMVAWSIEVTADMAEITSMQDTVETYAAGFLDWTATAECLLEDSGLDPDITTDLVDDNGAALVFNTGSSTINEIDYYSGTAIVIGISPLVDKNDVVKVTYTFQGNSELLEHEKLV